MSVRYAVVRWVPRGSYFGVRDSVTTGYYQRFDSACQAAAVIQAQSSSAVAVVVELAP